MSLLEQEACRFIHLPYYILINRLYIGNRKLHRYHFLLARIRATGIALAGEQCSQNCIGGPRLPPQTYT